MTKAEQTAWEPEERALQALEILRRHCQGQAGITRAEPVLKRMTPPARSQALEQVPGLAALLCCVFPYFRGLEPGNLSLYARGLDYHEVARDRLGRACRQLEQLFPGFRFRGYADISPFPEVYACGRAGLGLIGQNGLLLTRRWGSYVFCGLIATDLPLEGGREPEGCPACGLCIRACPGGALGGQGRLEPGRCLSALTQQKGQLSQWQQTLICQSGMAWGCDICQTACPYNREPEHTTLPEFLRPFPPSLTLEQLEGLSQRQFRQLYGSRAFAWRGIGPLRRNLALLAGRGASLASGAKKPEL